VNPPQDSTPPATGTWLKLDARDPEAEAAEAAYRKESSRLRRGVWIGNCVALLLLGGVVGAQYGALLTTRMKPDLLRLALAIIILVVAARVALGLTWRPDEIYSIESL